MALLAHLLFLVFRFFFNAGGAVVRAVADPLGFLTELVKGRPFEQSATVEKIEWRSKPEPMDLAKDENFITLGQRRAHPACVFAEDVLLYSINRREAVFVQMPRPVTEYSADKVPFLQVRSFQDAVRLIRMPLRSFYRLSEDLGDPDCRAVIIHNTGRCGSTLVCSMLQKASPEVCSLSEPDALSILWQMQETMPPAEFERLLRATLRMTFRPPPGRTTMVVKVRLMVVSLAAEIQRLLPGVKQFYLHRDPEKTIVSYERAFGDILLFQALRNMMKFNTWELGSRLFGIPLHPSLNPYRSILKASNFEVGALIWVDNFLRYLEQKKLIADFPDVVYEDLVERPAEIGKEMLTYCGLGEPEHLARALTAMTTDSQEGTPLSRDSLREKKATPITPDIVKRVNAFCTAVGVPLVFPPKRH